MDPEQSSASSDERVLALVCHLSMFFGAFIVPLIIYFIQKDKSKFVGFNALQAVYFHIAYFVFIILWYVIMFFFIGVGSDSISRNGMDISTESSMVFLVLFFLMFIALVFYFIIYAVIIAVKSYQGYIKKYPMVGNMAYRQVYERY